MHCTPAALPFLATAAALASCQSPEGHGTATPSTEHVFSFEASDGTPLEAKLSVPARRDPVPVVFYLHGASVRSYDNPFRYRDDEGEVQKANYLDYHAEQLGRRGIAFCRMSKRGCVASDEPPGLILDREVFAGATPTVLLDDYQRGLDALRKRPEIDPARVAFLGSSEGTWMAPRLARRSPRGVVGVAMSGYAADNTRDTVVWQTTVGPWRGIEHLLPAARDGRLTRAEYDEAVADQPALAQGLPFAAVDANGDEALTEDELAQLIEPRLDAILKAVEDRDDEFLAKNLLNLSSAYLLDWWTAEPNCSHLLELDIPLAIFHGALDNTCRVEGVRETEEAFRKAGKTNLTVHVYPDADHDLDWTWRSASDGGPEGYRELFAWIKELLLGDLTSR